MRRFSLVVLLVTRSVTMLASAAEPKPEPPSPAALEEKPISAAERGHWAFVPPRRPAIPATRDNGWLRNPIDAFILGRLESNGLRPAPEADRRTLLRRLSFDLTGLAPAPADLDAFVRDPSPVAYEKVVDRLLASPQFGERWAQHWLDLARYADSDGFEFDQARPNAWRYRDWVVEALNRDVPYDDFVRRQIAGDEVEPDVPSAFIATGFNRCYPDMVDLNDQGLRRQNALDDITETTGLVFLGLTIGCARCHDHKFDPIRQSDFFKLQAFFAGSRLRDDYPVVSRVERAAFEERSRNWRAEVAAVQASVIELESTARAGLAPGRPIGLTDDAVAALEMTAEDRSPDQVRLVFDALTADRRIAPGALVAALGPERSAERERLFGRLNSLKATAPPPLPLARGLDEQGPNPGPTYLLRRGDLAARGPEVFPAFPLVLCRSSADAQARPSSTAHSSGRRQALADWLIRPDHSLTGRVIVNRLWQHHFGRGIVGSPSDFGTMGDEPTHPELLDWLAVELVARDWSLKAMHRLIVTSAAYRQSARTDARSLAADPENTLFWRQRRLRLDGEALRDALLAVSGELNPSMGGPGVFPELPAELTRLSSKGAVWPVSPNPEDRRRRSLYIFVRRNLRYPFFEAFDRPDTNASCPRRAVTTIAPQALTLLNNRLAHDAASGFASRLRREAGSDPLAQIRRAYQVAFARDPDASESRLALDFLAVDRSLDRFCLALLNTNEFLYLD